MTFYRRPSALQDLLDRHLAAGAADRAGICRPPGTRDPAGGRRGAGQLARRIAARAAVACVVVLACAGPGATPPLDPLAVPRAIDVDALALRDELPLAPDVRSGTLANGLRYFIRRNTEPVLRAELRFVVDAGSVLEDEDQQGLAHFLEHMLFNGTERFPGSDVMSILQATGMRVGPDVNAFTGFDETVYVLKLPTDNPRILPIGFDIMEDWAANALLDPDEIEAERGVIVEERRLRLSAQGRASEAVTALFLDGSRYQERRPIGTLEVIQTAPRERLEAFYRTWYRPEHLSIIAVGDFDPLRVEQLIVERFAKLTNPKEPAPRPSTAVPAHDEPLLAVLTDPDQPTNGVTLGWKRPAPVLTTVEAYKSFLVAQMFDRMMNLRLLEVTSEPNAPIVQAIAARGLMVRSLEIWRAQALAEEGRLVEAVEILQTEVERARRHGFTAGELERVKKDIATSYERAGAEQRNTPSSALADELVRHVTTDEPVPGIAAEEALTRRFLPAITLDDVNAEARRLGPSSRVVVATLPDKKGLTAPDVAELRAALDRVAAADIGPYEDLLVEGELIANPPAPADIRSRREIPELDATEIILANGARVTYKRTALREQEVLFAATSPGGASLVSDEDFAEAALAAEVVSAGGVGDFSRSNLLRLLSGREATVVPNIGRHFEGMTGAARSADLPTLFKLLHLLFTAPRLDRTVLSRVQAEYVSRLENLGAVPEALLLEAVSDSLYPGNVRAGLLSVEEVQGLDGDRLFAIYRERFADASDFSFSFVGSFEPAELEALAQRYIGTLPATRSAERYRAVLPDAPKRVIRKTIERGNDERSQVRLVFEGVLPAIDADTYLAAELLEQAVGEELQGELREELGAVYGVAIEIDVSEIPKPSYSARIDFTTDPQRVEELIEVTFEKLAGLREKGPSEFSLGFNKRTLRRAREEDLGQNAFWLGMLQRRAQLPSFDPAQVRAYDQRLEAITTEDVRKLGEAILRTDQFVQVVLQPERPSSSGD